MTASNHCADCRHCIFALGNQGGCGTPHCNHPQSPRQFATGAIYPVFDMRRGDPGSFCAGGKLFEPRLAEGGFQSLDRPGQGLDGDGLHERGD